LKGVEKIITHEVGTLIEEDVKEGGIWRDRGKEDAQTPTKLSKEPHKSG